jgi:hypothetical protein
MERSQLALRLDRLLAGAGDQKGKGARVVCDLGGLELAA